MNTKMLFCLSTDFSKVTFQIEKTFLGSQSDSLPCCNILFLNLPISLWIICCPPLQEMLWHGRDWSFFASGKWQYMVLETICFQETLLWLFRRSWTLSTLSFWIARHDFFKLLKMMLLKAEKTFKISPSSNQSTVLKNKTISCLLFKIEYVLILGLQKHFMSIKYPLYVFLW